MLLTTTSQLQNKKIKEYKGLVTCEVTAGINVARDIFASFRNIFGGRVVSYEKELVRIRESALEEMQAKAEALGANAVIAVHLEYETLNGTIVMISASGTAIITE